MDIISLFSLPFIWLTHLQVVERPAFRTTILIEDKSVVWLAKGDSTERVGTQNITYAY
jgi:hypothetical protein